MNVYELAALLFYMVVMITVGIWFYWQGRKNVNSEKNYFLGDRHMNGWVSALSAGASDMSAWVLMGLPGAIYLHGVGQIWIAVGLLLGTICAWTFVAPRLRRYSIAADDSITVPQFLTNRFKTNRRTILIISSLVFMVTYCIYSASSIYACGTLFNTVLKMNPRTAMILATIVIVSYTLLGGYNAVCWTDFFQGMMMLAALMATPILAVLIMNSAGYTSPGAELTANYYSVLPGESAWKNAADIISGLGWGLGYFGMPHILIRYFSVKDAKEMRKSQIIGCTWIFIILAMACISGLLGRQYLGDALLKIKDGHTLVFINTVREVFAWFGNFTGFTAVAIFLAGLVLSAILAAAMSTADSQLLASSSAFASDLYKPLFRPRASNKEMLWASRIIVALIAIAAFIIAVRPECKGIMNLVSCAWGAFGAAFSPVILLAIFWKRFTYQGAVAGIIAGFAVDILWLLFLQEKTGVYEIVPGFIAGLIAAWIVSLLTEKTREDVIALFEKVKSKEIDI